MGSSCQRTKEITINHSSTNENSTPTQMLSVSEKKDEASRRPSQKEGKRENAKEYFSKEDENRLQKKNSQPIYRNLVDIDLTVNKLIEINRGSYGVVYKALNNTGTCFAIKVIEKKKTPDSSNLTSNSNGVITKETEINMLSKLQHKNIVQYYRYEEHEDRFDIYMEYCEDGTIQDQIIKYKKLDENVIRCYLRHILLGLEYLHFKKVAHRDIKSSNILISKGVCKLCDFGLSKDIWKEREIENEKLNKAYSIKGTYIYIAPEIMNQPYNGCLSDIDWFFSDIWSLGITTFQMATGGFPYSENQMHHMLFKPSFKIQDPPAIPVHLSKNLQDFIYGCLKINPHERYTVSQLLKHPFIVGYDQEDWRKDYDEDGVQEIEENPDDPIRSVSLN